MNCQTAQKQITDHLARGESGVPPKVQAHYGNCAECQTFYQAERGLFASLDAGLKSLANQPIPASLVSRVRAGLEQITAPRSSWTPGWGLATLAAVAVLVLSFGVIRARHMQGHPVPLGNPMVATKSTQPVGSAAGNQRMTVVTSPRVLEDGHVPARAAKTAEDMPKVIVLPEEREAFVRFVEGRTRQHAAAVLPAGPAQGDQPIDIALLEIKEVRIEALDPTAEQVR